MESGAGVDIFTLARRMGTSVAMIDRAYGHLAAGADEYERDLLDAFDRDARGSLGRYLDAASEKEESKWLDFQGWAVRDSNARPPACKDGVMPRA